jgi:hypothetical protein
MPDWSPDLLTTCSNPLMSVPGWTVSASTCPVEAAFFAAVGSVMIENVTLSYGKTSWSAAQ